MAHQSELISRDIESYLKEQENKEILRFITCGSVDDGKSTLIGRLLYDSKMIFEDQLASIKKESKKFGTTNESMDLSLLVDGLQSERAQGITIDVAYRLFSTDKRKFIIADTPGHEQYTRNMATGASTADLAIILIDATKGVLTQTKRHSYIVSLFGIKTIIVAINKMDLLDFNENRFKEIQKEYENIISNLANNKSINFIYLPISALHGDNIVNRSSHTPWYKGALLMELLNSVEFNKSNQLEDNKFRLPVQYVNRANQNFRGFAGTIASGSVNVGDEIVVLPSYKTSKIESIITPDIKEFSKSAYAPMAVTITLEDEIDVSRGDVIVHSDSIPEVSNKLDVTVVWMDEIPMELFSSYIIKRATSTVNGRFTSIVYKKDINRFKELKADSLLVNDIAKCTLHLDSEIAIDSYEENRYTGSFIVIDRYTNNTVGAGMILAVSKDEEKINSGKYSKSQKELNAYVREHFPEWECKAIF